MTQHCVAVFSTQIVGKLCKTSFSTFVKITNRILEKNNSNLQCCKITAEGLNYQ